MTEQVIGELQRALGRVEGGLQEFKDESSRQRTALFEKVDSQGHQLTELVAQVHNLISLAQNAASVPALAVRMHTVETTVAKLSEECGDCEVDRISVMVNEMKPRLDALHEKEISRKAILGAAAVGGGTLATLLPHAWTAVKTWFQHHPPG